MKSPLFTTTFPFGKDSFSLSFYCPTLVTKDLVSIFSEYSKFLSILWILWKIS